MGAHIAQNVNVFKMTLFSFSRAIFLNYVPKYPPETKLSPNFRTDRPVDQTMKLSIIFNDNNKRFFQIKF